MRAVKSRMILIPSQIDTASTACLLPDPYHRIVRPSVSGGSRGLIRPWPSPSVLAIEFGYPSSEANNNCKGVKMVITNKIVCNLIVFCKERSPSCGEESIKCEKVVID